MVFVLSTAGLHVPVMAGVLLELVGKLMVPPLQIGAIWVKVGVTGWFTVTVIVAVVAHCPAAGVKVYVVVAVLFGAGLQVPVIAGVFVELLGSVKGSPLQIGPTCVNVGVTGWFTVTVMVAVVAHWPLLGVKV